nr:hypothetical protein [Tanacetum cinerariifolium]
MESNNVEQTRNSVNLSSEHVILRVKVSMLTGTCVDIAASNYLQHHRTNIYLLGWFDEAIGFFESTLVTGLCACAQLGTGVRISIYIMNHQVSSDVWVVNGLVDMYAKCGDIYRSCKNSSQAGLFEEAMDMINNMEVNSWSLYII